MTIAGQILPDFLIRICEFLAIPLVKNSWCSIEVWTIVHILIAGLIFYLVRKKEKPLLLAFLLLILFEIFEVTISYLAPVILKESIQDVVFDLIFGFVGALIMYIILKVKK